MSMISEQVKGLRKLGNQWKHNDVAGYHLILDACDTIEALSEKVRANNLHEGWIPVSERLPSESGRYLVTYPLFRRKDKWVNLMNFGKPSMPNIKVKGKCWYVSDDEYGDVVYDDILAWMPLPEPYLEDGE